MAASNNATIVISAVDQTTAAFKSIDENFKKLGKSLDIIKGAVAFEFIKRGIEAVVEATVAAEKSQFALQATLRATGFAAGKTTAQLDELADSLKNSTNFDDDKLREAEVALLKFRDVQGDTFDRALKAVTDLAATDGDLVHWAEVVGKAINSAGVDLRALKTAGVSFNDTQEALIRGFQRTGNAAGIASVVLAEIEKHVGGNAAAQKQGITGALAATAIAYDDMLKAIGRSAAVQGAAQGLLGFITDQLKNIDFIMSPDFMKRLDQVTLFGFHIPGTAKNPNAEHGASGSFAETAEEKKQREETEKAKAGEAARTAERKAEAARLEAIRTERTKSAFSIQFADESVNAERQAGDRKLALLELQKQQGLIALKEEYAERKEIRDANLNAEINAVTQRIAREQVLAAQARKANKPEDVDAAELAIDKFANQRAQLRDQLKHSGDIGTEQLKIDVQAFKDSVSDISVAASELTGSAADVSDQAFDRSHRVLIEQMKRNAIDNTTDPAANRHAFDELNALKAQTKAQKEFSEEQAKSAILDEQLANEQSSIAAKRTAGTISELEASRQSDEQIQRSLPAMRELADQWERIAYTLSGPAGDRARQDVENFRARIEGLAAAADSTGQRFQQIFESSFVSGLDAFADGSKSAGDAFLGFARDVAKGLEHILAQEAASTLFKGAGGLLAKIGPFISNTHAAGTTAAPVGYQGGIQYDVPALAGGGDVSAGSFYTVGERGPELLYANDNGTVIPNNQLNNMGGGGGMTFHQTVNVAPGTDPGTLARVMFAAKEQAKRELADSWRRGTGPRTR